MRYRSYRYRLDQLSDILGNGRIEKISMLRRNHGFHRPQTRRYVRRRV